MEFETGGVGTFRNLTLLWMEGTFMHKLITVSPSLVRPALPAFSPSHVSRFEHKGKDDAN